MFDVLGLGACAVDEVLYVEGYPVPDSKTRVVRREVRPGGLTATALAVAANLGGRCAYGGYLGHDPDSNMVREWLFQAGVDVSHAVDEEDAGASRSVVIVDVLGATRTVFSIGAGKTGAHPSQPPEEVIRSTRVLLVDHVGAEGMLRALDIAARSGIPAVADVERQDSPEMERLLNLSSHPVISRRHAQAWTGLHEISDILHALWRESRGAVVITDGAQGSWWTDRGLYPDFEHEPAFPVAAVDTTGCGDVFHGAFALGLARGRCTGDCVRLATAASGLWAGRNGDWSELPSMEDVQRFAAPQGK